MRSLIDVLTIIFLLLLSPLIGIAVGSVSLLFFFAFPVWIAWRVFLERVLKRNHGFHPLASPSWRSR